MDTTNFKECPTKLNCYWYRENENNKNKADKLQVQNENLKKSKEILDFLKINNSEDIEDKFNNALSNNLFTEKQTQIDNLKRDITFLEKKNQEFEQNYKQLKKEKSYLQEIFDRDVEMQNLEKNYQILKAEFEKKSNLLNIINNDLNVSKADLESVNSIYNEIVDKHKELSKEVHKYRKELNILVKKKFKKDKKEAKLKKK